ncbi:hypothetical protein IC213_18260 [Clostridioides sp. ES-S-0049-02]|uniref:hypothetical protein n=1 Tax=Clostridioides sp. ES-S-0049-02 TaxID=2770778 RepID=UPI001D13052B|nr:hypothetical protein [Clostridioides sp. ES-S-0049-02]
MYEQRKAKVLFTTSGGTASKGSVTNRVTIPTTWIKHMDITKLEREVLLTFDGNKIIIEKIDE